MKQGRAYMKRSDGQVVAARYRDWKVVFAENRASQLQIWKVPFVQLIRDDTHPATGIPVPADHEGLSSGPNARLMEPAGYRGKYPGWNG